LQKRPFIRHLFVFFPSFARKSLVDFPHFSRIFRHYLMLIFQ